MRTAKLGHLLRIAPRNPVEVWDRARSHLELRSDIRETAAGNYRPVDWETLLDGLDEVLEGRSREILCEQALHQIEMDVRERRSARSMDAPWRSRHDGDFVLGRLCYLVVRATRPEVVLETGVAYGVTSAFILQALKVNGTGVLHSIDLPPLGKDADAHVGALIPEELRDRWQLHRGPSKRLLEPVLTRLGSVDVFVHDSLHTYKTMRWEFETVERFLRPGGVVVSDDVQGNAAFDEWCAARNGCFSAVLREESKESLLGVSIG